MRDCREKWRICEGNRKFLLETLVLIKGIFVIFLKVGVGQDGTGRVGANTRYHPAPMIGAKFLPHTRPATFKGRGGSMRVCEKLPSLIHGYMLKANVFQPHTTTFIGLSI